MTKSSYKIYGELLSVQLGKYEEYIQLGCSLKTDKKGKTPYFYQLVKPGGDTKVFLRTSDMLMTAMKEKRMVRIQYKKKSISERKQKWKEIQTIRIYSQSTKMRG